MTQSITIVVVEDDPSVGHTLVRQLDRLGYRGHLVRDPLQAPAALEAEHPALIVSDLNMPECSGVDVLFAARERYPNLKRCLISGSLQDLQACDLPRILPCVILSKPLRLDDLRQLLRECELPCLEVPDHPAVPLSVVEGPLAALKQS